MKVGECEKRLGAAEREFLQTSAITFHTPLRNFLEGDWRTISVSCYPYYYWLNSLSVGERDVQGECGPLHYGSPFKTYLLTGAAAVLFGHKGRLGGSRDEEIVSG